MGLDMYLTKRTDVKNWNFQKEKFDVTVKRDGKEFTEIKKERVHYVEEEVMYWRKFNALHNWFVQEVQDGEDDCDEYYVSREDLKNLLELLKHVQDALNKAPTEIIPMEVGWQGSTNGFVPIMENRTVYKSEFVQNIFPPTKGFFFGAEYIGDWFKQDVDETVKVLDEELKTESQGSYYYHSSW